MTLYLSANYNDTAVKLNLKKLSDSFHMCPRSAFVLSSGTCHGFFAAWAHSHMVWKKPKKKLGLAWLTMHLYQEQGIFSF